MTDMAYEGSKVERKSKAIGKSIIRAIQAGLNNKAVLRTVKAHNPECKTTLASIQWYRKKLRAEGFEIPMSRESRDLNPTEIGKLKDLEDAQKGEYDF
jgi:hypothetical protein